MTHQPLLTTGQTVYIVELDSVNPATVTSHWFVEPGDRGRVAIGDGQYGYRVTNETGCRCVIWDFDVGETVFLADAAAREAAANAEVEKVFPSPDSTEITECESWAYLRRLDIRIMPAVLAKVGDLQLYEKDFMCYHFLRTYKTKKARDTQYKKMQQKIRAEAAENKGFEVPPTFDVLYKVGDLYASRDYALHHLTDR